MKELIKKIASIQKELKAPKNQYNNFGKYKYRSCEDILEAVKPLVNGIDCILTISDEIVMLGDRYYVKATAEITDGTNSISNTAYARESLDKKGMDDSQITGAASSYARKYALNGLLCIDDTKDAETDEHTEQTKKSNPAEQPKLSKQCQTEMLACETIPELDACGQKWAKTEDRNALASLYGIIKTRIAEQAKPTTEQIIGDEIPSNLK